MNGIINQNIFYPAGWRLFIVGMHEYVRRVCEWKSVWNTCKRVPVQETYEVAYKGMLFNKHPKWNRTLPCGIRCLTRGTVQNNTYTTGSDNKCILLVATEDFICPRYPLLSFNIWDKNLKVELLITLHDGKITEKKNAKINNFAHD